MPDASLFRGRLAARILVIAGAAQLACRGGGPAVREAGSATSTSSASSAGSGGGHAGAGGGVAGAGGQGGADTFDTGGGGAGGGATTACFGWPDDAGAPGDAGGPDGGSCPTDEIDVLVEFIRAGCPTGWIPHSILSGPSSPSANTCCYSVKLGLCPCGGRPYLEEGVARVSAALRGAAGAGWAPTDAPVPGDPAETAPLSPEDRAALADAWTAEALAEHASIASFSRFALALLAAGAPADLQALAHEAALDEVRHAALAFALASAYAGEIVAPGPFPLGASVRVDASLDALVAGTVHEGCVGETVAAVIAAERRDRATDPAVRAALAQIADDEARHAELAWRVVAWALRAGGPEVQASAARAFAEALALATGAGEGARAGDAPDDTEGSAARAGHGLLPASSVARAARRALNEVVAPGAQALLARAS